MTESDPISSAGAAVDEEVSIHYGGGDDATPNSDARRFEEIHASLCKRHENAVESVLEDSIPEIKRLGESGSNAEIQESGIRNKQALPELHGSSEEIQCSCISDDSTLCGGASVPEREMTMDTNPDVVLHGSSEQFRHSCGRNGPAFDALSVGPSVPEREIIVDARLDELPNDEIWYSCRSTEPISHAVEREKIMDGRTDERECKSSVEDFVGNLADNDGTKSSSPWDSSSDFNNNELEFPGNLRDRVLQINCESLAMPKKGDAQSSSSKHSSSDLNSTEVELPEDPRKGVLQINCESFTSSEKDDAQSSLPRDSSSDLNNAKAELPEDLRKGVLELNCDSFASHNGYCRVYLVGTAHVSQESCRQVEAAIRYLKPEVVFLELCESRSSILLPQSLKVPTFKDMMEMWRTKHMNIFGILYSWFLAKIADRLEVFPGSEFRVAYEEAIACGAKILLGDRHVQVTLKRTWAKMSTWYKMKLILSMVSQALFLPSIEELSQMIQEMDNMDMVTLLIQEMSKSFPTLLETLVHERDMYMAAMLHRVAEHHSLIVAVVGKGHLSGITKNWNKDISVNALLELPEKKSWSLTSFKCLSAMAFVVGALAVASGCYLFVREQ